MHFHTIPSQTQTFIPVIPFFNHSFLTKREYYENASPDLNNPVHFCAILDTFMRFPYTFIWFWTLPNDLKQKDTKQFLLILINHYVEILLIWTCSKICDHISFSPSLRTSSKKDVMLTNPCFYVFGDAFRLPHFYCTH